MLNRIIFTGLQILTLDVQENVEVSTILIVQHKNNFL